MITTISTLPPVPNRNDPGTFSDKADSFLGAMPTLVSELNEFVSEVNTLSFKTACKVATTTNLSSLVYPTVSTIDGVSINTGDRVLVKNQNTASQNGIYTVGGNNIVWTRAADMDTAAEVAGSFVPVTFGVQNGGKIYYTTFNATGGVVGTTDIPWNSLTEGSITGIGVLAVANGGTGISSYAVGDLIYATGTASLAKLAAAAAGNVLKSGTAPSWGKVALASDVSGTLPAANGGTGLTGPGSIGNVLTSNGGGWASSALPSASASASGIVELATTAEVRTGTDTVRAITPAGLRAEALVQETSTATTSGTSIALSSTSIPSWARRITVIFSGVSTNTASNYLLQVRRASDSGWITTGYTSMASDFNGAIGTPSDGQGGTQGFLLTRSPSAASLTSGTVTLVKLSGTENIWISSGTLGDHATAVSSSAGRLDMASEVLNNVRLTTVSGTATFDAGKINVLYE